ncbi:MAG: DUF4136 domain-containing protein [Bacteroidales bacterium]|nr:DUF4136 domain-containing protein [Bacteroidales bacterium]
MKKIIFPLLILFLVSCNPWKYVGVYDHQADFSQYKTFGLLNWNPANDKIVQPETKKNILMAIKHQLERRGYVYQENGAVLQVSVFVIVKQETSYSAYTNHYAGYNGYGAVAVGVGVGSGGVGVGAVGYGMPNYPYTMVNHDYEVGTVIIDLLDDAKKRQVWQGVATGRIITDVVSADKVNKTIDHLFKTLPVKKVKK